MSSIEHLGFIGLGNKGGPLAAAAGLALPGAEAAHRVFADRGWEVVIDFDDYHHHSDKGTPEPIRSDNQVPFA